MSQFDFGNLSSPLSGTAFIDSNLEPWRDALHSSHSGSSRPSYAVKGTVWLDTGATPNVLFMFDGTATDIKIGEFDISGGTFSPAGSSQYGGSAGGTGDVITLTPTIPLGAYAAGVAFDYLVTATNTVIGPTINVSGLGTQIVKCSVGGGKVSLPIGGLPSGMIARIVNDGTDFMLLNIRQYNKGANIATAGTVNLDNATGDYVHWTGTTTVNTITISEGREITCVADDAFQLTDSSGDSPPGLIVPGGEDHTTVVGDVFVVRGEANGTARIISYNVAANAPGGAVPQAIQANIEAEADEDSYVPPDLLKFNPGVAKAWLSFTTVTTTAIESSHNITSVSDNGTGDTTITIATNFSTANYAAVAMVEHEDASPSAARMPVIRNGGQAAGTLRVLNINQSGSTIDVPTVCVAMFGDQS